MNALKSNQQEENQDNAAKAKSLRNQNFPVAIQRRNTDNTPFDVNDQFFVINKILMIWNNHSKIVLSYFQNSKLTVMARQKEFEKEEVLEKAMDTFWHFGFEGTSMQNLVENMGISRSSLYDAFGDKRSLFEAAITHYEKTRMQAMVDCLQEKGASKSAIVNSFHSLIDQSISDEERRGCFITNTAIELCPHDPGTAKKIATDMKIVEKAFYQALVNAQNKGEISIDKDLSSIAQYLTSSFQGIRVMAKVNQEPEFLKNIVKVTLSVLD